MNKFLKGVFFCCTLLSLSVYAEEDAMQILDRMREKIEKEEAEKAKLAAEARELGIKPGDVKSTEEVEAMIEAKKVEEAKPKTEAERLELTRKKALNKLDFYERVVRSVAREEADGTMLALLLVGSVSFADDDADKKRLLEEYDKMQAEKAKEQPQVAETTEVVTENGEVVATEGEQVAIAPKKAEKDMTESERMDVEIQRIKTRILAINEKIENYNKTNEMIDNLEKNVGELERKVNY